MATKNEIFTSNGTEIVALEFDCVVLSCRYTDRLYYNKIKNEPKYVNEFFGKCNFVYDLKNKKYISESNDLKYNQILNFPSVHNDNREMDIFMSNIDEYEADYVEDGGYHIKPIIVGNLAFNKLGVELYEKYSGVLSNSIVYYSKRKINLSKLDMLIDIVEIGRKENYSFKNRHCAFFGPNEIIDTSISIFDNKKFLFVEFDTESG